MIGWGATALAFRLKRVGRAKCSPHFLPPGGPNSSRSIATVASTSTIGPSMILLISAQSILSYWWAITLRSLINPRRCGTRAKVSWSWSANLLDASPMISNCRSIADRSMISASRSIADIPSVCSITRLAARRMSQRKAADLGCIEESPGLLNRVQNVRILDVANLNEIHFPPDDL